VLICRATSTRRLLLGSIAKTSRRILFKRTRGNNSVGKKS
jgi:hypothetical protein